MSIHAAAAPISAAAIQPIMVIGRLAVKVPMTDFFEASKTMTTIKGAETTPLMIALQNNAFIGLIGRYCMTSPASTLTAMML
jgi:hypothetical protein